jgi:hypothetical protein
MQTFVPIMVMAVSAVFQILQGITPPPATMMHTYLCIHTYINTYIHPHTQKHTCIHIHIYT